MEDGGFGNDGIALGAEGGGETTCPVGRMLFVLATSASLIVLRRETWGIIVGIYIFYGCNLCVSLSVLIYGSIFILHIQRKVPNKVFGILGMCS